MLGPFVLFGKRGECRYIGFGDEANKVRICVAVCAAPASVLLFVSSSMRSICFGFRISVQRSATLLVSTPSVPLIAETLRRYDVGMNYVIKFK